MRGEGHHETQGVFFPCVKTLYFSMKLELLITGCPGTGTGFQQPHEFLFHMPLVLCVDLSKYLTGAGCCASDATQVSLYSRTPVSVVAGVSFTGDNTAQ